jgi:hypothetical protein
LRFLGVLIGLIASPTIAFAQTGVQSASVALMTGVAWFVAIIITALDVLTWFLFRFLDILLDPSFIFGDEQGPGTLMGMLREIWTLSRDIMNIFFAVLLIIGALYFIIKAGSDTGAKFKEQAPKFIMAVILVNFSWFVPRVIFDVSQVLTVSVFQIPQIITGAADCTLPLPPGQQGPPQPCKVVTNVYFLEEADTVTPGVDGWECPIKRIVCIQLLNFDDPKVSKASHTVIINGLVVNHGRLRTLANVPEPQAPPPGQPTTTQTQVKEFLTFLMRMIIALLLHIALFFPLLALVVAFFIRIPILWLTMAFMPFVFLGLLVGDKLGSFNPMEKIWKRFLTAVFMPALVAIPFAVGFIMINMGSKTSVPGSWGTLNSTVKILPDVGDFWQFFWMLMSLFVLWVGVFAVLKQDELIGSFVEKIDQTGRAAGQIALKAPLAAPVLPGTSVTPLQALKAINPRNILGEINRSGKIDEKTMKNILGAPHASAVDDAKKDIQSKKTIADINTTVKILTDEANPARQAIEAKRIVDAHSKHGLDTLSRAIAELGGVSGKPDEEKIHKALKAEFDKRSANPPPAAPPAPPGGTPPGGAPPAPTP